MWYVIRNDELYHHGIKGQKWGVRRFQNEDGSLTAAGKKRYMEADPNDSDVTKRVKADWNNLSEKQFRKKYQTTKSVYEKRVNKYGDPYMNSPLAKAGKKLSGIKKQEKKSGKKFETPEEVMEAERRHARRTSRAFRLLASSAIMTASAALAVKAYKDMKLDMEVQSMVNGTLNRTVNDVINNINLSIGTAGKA